MAAKPNSIWLAGNKETAIKYKHFQKSIVLGLNTDHLTDHKR